MTLKLISFCLFGSAKKYTVGAVENARMAPDFYPEWTTLFWLPPVGSPLSPPDEVVQELTDLNAVIAYAPPVMEEAMLFARYLTADMNSVERWLARDADSRFSEREVAAVREWEKSGLPFHTCRDNPSHCRGINGGMFGSVNGTLPNMRASILEWLRNNKPPFAYDYDQQFLNDVIWPLVKDNAMQHDSCCKYEGSRPFPMRRQGQRFMGEVIESNGQPRARDYECIVPDSF